MKAQSIHSKKTLFILQQFFSSHSIFPSASKSFTPSKNATVAHLYGTPKGFHTPPPNTGLIIQFYPNFKLSNY